MKTTIIEMLLTSFVILTPIAFSSDDHGGHRKKLNPKITMVEFGKTPSVCPRTQINHQ